MSTFFVDPYKNYYDKLNLHTDLVQESKKLEEFFSSSVQIINTVSSQLQSGVWSELGKNELISSSVPGLISGVQAVSDSITDGLASVCSIAINELLDNVTKLKDEDANYENIKDNLGRLVSVPRYDSNGIETLAYRQYITEKNSLENELTVSSGKCKEYQKAADSAVNSIKAMDASISSAPANSDGGQDTFDVGSGFSLIASSSDNLLTVNYSGEDYYLINTKVPVLDYAEHVQKNRMYQNAGALNGQCMIASQIYARDLLKGVYTSYKDFVNKAGSPATRINERVVSDNKSDVLEYVYNEVVQGHPVVLQVTQKKSNQGLRHLVTVVGFKKTVTSASDLTDSDLLVLDNVDGKVQNLSERNRTLYNQGNKGYQALGPTETFLAKEVETLPTTDYA